MVWFPLVGDIFGNEPFFKSRIRPLALHPMLALAPAASKGEVFGFITFLLRIVVGQGMPRTRGPLGGPQIVGWIAQGPTTKQRRRESKQP